MIARRCPNYTGKRDFSLSPRDRTLFPCYNMRYGTYFKECRTGKEGNAGERRRHGAQPAPCGREDRRRAFVRARLRARGRHQQFKRLRQQRGIPRLLPHRGKARRQGAPLRPSAGGVRRLHDHRLHHLGARRRAAARICRVRRGGQPHLGRAPRLCRPRRVRPCQGGHVLLLPLHVPLDGRFRPAPWRRERQRLRLPCNARRHYRYPRLDVCERPFGGRLGGHLRRPLHPVAGRRRAARGGLQTPGAGARRGTARRAPRLHLKGRGRSGRARRAPLQLRARAPLCDRPRRTRRERARDALP